MLRENDDFLVKVMLAPSIASNSAVRRRKMSARSLVLSRTPILSPAIEFGKGETATAEGAKAPRGSWTRTFTRRPEPEGYWPARLGRG